MRWLERFLLVLAVLCAAAPAWSRTHHRGHERKGPGDSGGLAKDPGSFELEPPPAGEAGAPDYAALSQTIEESYRHSPTPELLYRLGALYHVQGRTLEAQDLMRRYLADPLTDPRSEHRLEAEQVAALPRVPCGEVQVVTDQDGFIFLDGRLVGAVPLSLPLLVPVGSHIIALEMRDKTMRGKLKVLDGRGIEMRFNRESGAVVVTLPPAVIVLYEYAGVAGATMPSGLLLRLRQTTDQALLRAHLASYSKEAALQRAPKLAGCLETLSCQEELAKKSEVDYVLRLRIEHPAATAPQSYTLSLIDAEVGDVAATAQRTCSNCRIDEQITIGFAEVLKQVLKEGQGRPHGTLVLASDPAGAEIRAGAQLLGKTPYQHVLFAGSYDLLVKEQDYAPERLQVVVQEGKTARAAVALKSVEPPPAPLVKVPSTPPSRRLPRPRWRLVTGGVAMGLGLILGGFGISGIAIDNQCVSAPDPNAINCRQRFDTLSLGAGLLGAGAALSAAGAVLIAVPAFPGERQSNKPPVPSQYKPSGLELTLSF